MFQIETDLCLCIYANKDNKMIFKNMKCFFHSTSLLLICALSVLNIEIDAIVENTASSV